LADFIRSQSDLSTRHCCVGIRQSRTLGVLGAVAILLTTKTTSGCSGQARAEKCSPRCVVALLALSALKYLTVMYCCSLPLFITVTHDDREYSRIRDGHMVRFGASAPRVDSSGACGWSTADCTRGGDCRCSFAMGRSAKTRSTGASGTCADEVSRSHRGVSSKRAARTGCFGFEEIARDEINVSCKTYLAQRREGRSIFGPQTRIRENVGGKRTNALVVCSRAALLNGVQEISDLGDGFSATR